MDEVGGGGGERERICGIRKREWSWLRRMDTNNSDNNNKAVTGLL